jgi:hypothetical protein
MRSVPTVIQEIPKNLAGSDRPKVCLCFCAEPGLVRPQILPKSRLDRRLSWTASGQGHEGISRRPEMSETDYLGTG